MSGNELSGIELQRKRGDTAADEITVLDDDSTLDPKPPLNIAGFGFFLTVNTEREPDPGAVPPIGVELFSLAGVITDAANGKVEFTPTALQADQGPDVYWYDVQQIDGTGGIKTVIKNKYRFFQDITKA